MNSTRLTERGIASDFIYVFFQHADHPEHPSYIRMDLSEGSWSSPVTLTAIRLSNPENGQYACDPRAAFWNNQIYLFGRGADSGIEVMTTDDGTNWSDQTLLSKSGMTRDAVTPIAWWNNMLLIFYITTDNIFRCDMYDPAMNMYATWRSSDDYSIFPVGAISNPQAPVDMFYNNAGTCCYQRWSINSGFSSPYLSGPALSQGPSPFTCAGGVFLATRGDSTNRVLYITQQTPTPSATEAPGTPNSDFQQPALIEGVNIYTAPSAVVLDDSGTTATIAVFYVENDESHELRMAVISIDNSSGTANYRLVNMQAIGIPLAGANASPFALLIP